MRVVNTLRDQFEYSFRKDLADIKKLFKVIEVHRHENGLVAFCVNESTDEYVLCIRTAGFRGVFEYVDAVQMLGEWFRAKRDLESGGYGPWERHGYDRKHLT